MFPEDLSFRPWNLFPWSLCHLRQTCFTLWVFPYLDVVQSYFLWLNSMFHHPSFISQVWKFIILLICEIVLIGLRCFLRAQCRVEHGPSAGAGQRRLWLTVQRQVSARTVRSWDAVLTHASLASIENSRKAPHTLLWVKSLFFFFFFPFPMELG